MNKVFSYARYREERMLTGVALEYRMKAQDGKRCLIEGQYPPEWLVDEDVFDTGIIRVFSVDACIQDMIKSQILSPDVDMEKLVRGNAKLMWMEGKSEIDIAEAGLRVVDEWLVPVRPMFDIDKYDAWFKDTYGQSRVKPVDHWSYECEGLSVATVVDMGYHISTNAWSTNVPV